MPFEAASVILLFLNFYLYAFLAEFLMERKYSAFFTYGCLFPVALWTLWIKLDLLWPTGYVSLLTSLLYVLFSKIFYDGTWKQILFILVSYIVLNVAVYYIVLVPIYVFFDPELFKNMAVGSFQGFLLSFVMNVILYILGGILILLVKRELISYSGRMLILGFFTLQLFFLFVQPYVTRKMGWVHTFEEMDLFLPMLVIVANLMVVLSYILSDEKRALEERLLQTAYLEQVQRNYYRSLVNFQEEKEWVLNHSGGKIAELRQSLEKKEKSDVNGKVQELAREIQHTKGRQLSLHPVVDAVLAEKRRECAREQISLEFSVTILKEIGVEGIHLCNVFSNLLDNAIRANLALSPKERRISLKAFLDGDYLFVEVRNPSLTERTKKRKHHGYGTRILEDIAEKYNGSYRHTFGDGMYRAQMLLKPKAL